jgi:hypothetical protein
MTWPRFAGSSPRYWHHQQMALLRGEHVAVKVESAQTCTKNKSSRGIFAAVFISRDRCSPA